MKSSPLDRFPLVRTSSPEEMREFVAHNFGALAFDLPSGTDGFFGKSNSFKIKNIELNYCAYGVPAHVRFPGDGIIKLQIGLNGHARVSARGNQTPVSDIEGCISSGDDDVAVEFGAGYDQLVLRIDASAPAETLAGLLGFRPRGEIVFEPAIDYRHPQLQSFRRLVMFLVNELDDTEVEFPGPTLVEYEQMLLVTLLCAHRHNFSHLLEKEPEAALPWQVRISEDYIEANWDKPITVDKLADFAGASVRSIFKGFKESRGYSPMAFAKQKKLEHARNMLDRPGPTASVTAVAFRCGFSNMGHFARDYSKAFGERPSDTLRRAKGSRQDS